MVDVTKKKETTRTAIAQGKIKVNDEIFEKVKEGSMAKGVEIVTTTHIDKLTAWGGAADPVPWTTIFTGILIVTSSIGQQTKQLFKDR